MSPLFPLQPLVSGRGTSNRIVSTFLCITRQTLWRVLNAEGWRDGRTHRYIVTQIQKNTVSDSQLPRFKIHYKTPFNSAVLENNHNKLLWGSGGDSYSNSLRNWRLNWYETVFVLVQFIKHYFHEVYIKEKGRGFSLEEYRRNKWPLGCRNRNAVGGENLTFSPWALLQCFIKFIYYLFK